MEYDEVNKVVIERKGWGDVNDRQHIMLTVCQAVLYMLPVLTYFLQQPAFSR